MPYIDKESRRLLDEAIEELVESLNLCPAERIDGWVNYVVTRILVQLYPEPRYHDINRIMGVLECIKQEYYRRVAGPYEDKKISENGDVY